ncbi:flagellar motor switch protein FliN [Aeoliella sp.]|uniref:flagellar motor switch protein FliN n=1 Tax=Aeoliella sp. TaxID=2795800 RepID=UPI003CCB7411
MADENIGQDEIERLLAQAQEASGQASSEPPPADEAPAPEETAATPPPPPPPAAEDPTPAAPPMSATLDQAELDAMLSGAAAAPTPPPASAAPSVTPVAHTPTGDGSSNVSQNDIELLLNQAEQAIASIDTPVELPPGVQAFHLDDLGGSPASSEAATLELVRDVQLDLKIELGRTHMHLEDVLRLRQGAVVPLDKLAGDPVDLYVNGRIIARGEVLVLNDNFCVRVTELIVGDSACA